MSSAVSVTSYSWSAVTHELACRRSRRCTGMRNSEEGRVDFVVPSTVDKGDDCRSPRLQASGMLPRPWYAGDVSGGWWGFDAR